MADKAGKSDSAGRSGASGGFVTWLATRLRHVAEKLAPATEEASAEAARPLMARASSPHMALDDLLKAYLTDRGDSAVSKLHVISLDEMKQAFGDDWHRLSRKAMMITEGILRQHLGEHDYYCRQDDDSYLVLLPGLGMQAAATRIQGITEVVRRRLLGEQADNLRGFGVKAAVVTLSELMEQGTIPSLENITRILDERLPDEIGVRTLRRRGETGPITPQARVYESLDVRFRPVWNPASQLVFAFQIQPYRTTDYGVFAGQWTLNGGYLDPLGIEVDKKVIAEAIKASKTLKGDKTTPVIVLPLHFKSFTGQARNDMFSLLSKLLDHGKREHVAFELVGLLDSLPASRLPQIVSALGRLARFVAVRAVPDQFDHLRGTLNEVRLLGIDLNDISRHGADTASRSRVLAAFARFAREQGVSTYAWDLRTLDEVRLAMDLGFGNLGGLAVAPEMTEPRAIYELGVERVARPKTL
ncbi:hypothetical protein [Pararhodospirillum photometricum]|nr:hypothetical protein [Pararhodospirillum photometricum]